MELCWQLEEKTIIVGAQLFTVINLVAGAGSRLGSCLLNDINVPAQFFPVGTCMWLVVIACLILLVSKWT